MFKLYGPVHYFLFDACEEENGYCKCYCVSVSSVLFDCSV